jgi:hypothetical protein
MQTIVERMKFAGDETNSTAPATDETKTEAPTDIKITPAAFVQGKLKHSYLLGHLSDKNAYFADPNKTYCDSFMCPVGKASKQVHIDRMHDF